MLLMWRRRRRRRRRRGRGRERTRDWEIVATTVAVGVVSRLALQCRFLLLLCGCRQCRRCRCQWNRLQDDLRTLQASNGQILGINDGEQVSEMLCHGPLERVGSFYAPEA